MKTVTYRNTKEMSDNMTTLSNVKNDSFDDRIDNSIEKYYRRREKNHISEHERRCHKT